MNFRNVCFSLNTKIEVHLFSTVAIANSIFVKLLNYSK